MYEFVQFGGPVFFFCNQLGPRYEKAMEEEIAEELT